jgi:LacI family transcriptional regulator
MSAQRQVLLLLDTSNTYHRKIIRGVAMYAHKVGNWALRVVHDANENQVYVEQDPLESGVAIHSCQADGVIAAFHGQGITKAVCKLTISVVGIEPDLGWLDSPTRFPSFATDNRAIGRLAAEDLINRGFTHLAYCGIPRTRVTGWSQERAEAFRKCAADAGFACSVFTGGLVRGRNWPKMQQELLAWLESLPRPVGILACYDVRAQLVLDACRILGVVVPEEAAVIGVDNDEMLCELSNPPLSSIEQGARNLGFQAAAVLDQLMAGDKLPPAKTLVAPEGIVTRRSSDTWAIDDPDVLAAARFIREHACEGIQVGDVVHQVAVARSTLEASFKAHMNRTIHAEIQRVRIDRVRQLIATTDLPLKQIAIEAGFSYLQHMTTLFRQHVGQTPAQYRKNVHG